MTNRNSRVITIVALVIGVVALTIGFAAFTQSLNINNSTAEVKPSNSLNVHFPTSGTMTPTTSGAGVTGASVSLAATTISGLKANFNAPGQSVTYSTTIMNDSSYVAYLKSVTFSKATPTCAPLTGTDNNPASESTLSAVCSNMVMEVTLGSTGSYLVQNLNHTESSITGKSISAGGSIPCTVVLKYNGSAVPDGDFTVDFGNITFGFSSTS